MKQGKTLVELAKELERHKEAKKDYVAPQGALALAPVFSQEDPDDVTGVSLTGLNGSQMRVTPHAHGQLATHLQIPKAYYDRMLVEQPDLLALNVNAWLQKEPNEKRMIRTLDGNARAFLSSKYRPLDNYDLATAVLPVLQERGVRVMSAELTETRMYIKGILDDLSDKEFVEASRSGEYVHGQGLMKESRLVAAIVISNSEIGAGSLRIEPSVFTTRCTNLAIIAQAAMRKYHVGRTTDAMEDFSVFHDDTRKADDKAFWLKVRDITLAAFDGSTFKKAIESIRGGQAEKIESDNIAKVVEVTTKRLNLAEGLQNSILTHLARGGDMSKWGLSSALTAAANEQEDYEVATELERAGGKVIDLSPSDWKVIAQAA